MLCTGRRDVALNADWLSAGQDAESGSNVFRGEAQQGRLTRGLREWSRDRDEVESEHRRKVSGHSCSSGCTVGIFRNGAGYIEAMSHLFRESHLQGLIAFMIIFIII